MIPAWWAVEKRRDFPSAKVALPASRLGCNQVLIPPHRPDLNAYVERFHRSLGHEWGPRPSARDPARGAGGDRAVSAPFQPATTSKGGAGSRNQPPRVACPVFPTLPTVPETVVTSRWLVQVDKRAFARTIRARGDVTINHQDYSVSRCLAGQRVTCSCNAAEKQFDIWMPEGFLKSVPIKGRPRHLMPFEAYVALMKREAHSEYRAYLRTHPRLIQARLWA
jgi:hypothetical protein